MRIIKIDISKIKYTYKQYDQSLYDSIVRIGFSFPISCQLEEDTYICIDGHKRLSVLKDILINIPNYKRGKEVCVIVKNNDNTRSNDCWRGRNSH
ncbi:MAG: hypothetical protein RR585_09700 [Coprobacillus sp.]